MIKGRALRRALETQDAIRINGDVPLIVDTTELITPEIAQEMLKKNKSNRPVNWRKVEEYAKIMERGEWKLHSQGIIIDPRGNLLTGQKRLWAVIYSGKNVYMRVSRGCPTVTQNIIDRGIPQSARDLASRETDQKHSPIEASMARGICALEGKYKPTIDELGKIIVQNKEKAKIVISETNRIKKNKSILMVLSAICFVSNGNGDISKLTPLISKLVDRLDTALIPQTTNQCWGRGAAFGLAMQHCKRIVNEAQN